MSLRIAVLPGDGTGPEVIDEALRVLEAVAGLESFEYTTETFDYGGDRYLATGKIISPEEIAHLRDGFDTMLLGAIGHPDVQPGILEKGLLLELRFKLDQYLASLVRHDDALLMIIAGGERILSRLDAL